MLHVTGMFEVVSWNTTAGCACSGRLGLGLVRYNLMWRLVLAGCKRRVSWHEVRDRTYRGLSYQVLDREQGPL